MARDLYRFFRDSCKIVYVDSEMLDSSMDLHLARDGQLSVADCATLQAMIRAHEKTILSFYADFDDLPGITRLH